MNADPNTSATALLKLLEDRFNLKDIKVIQNELKNFNGLQILSNETAESFVNRIQVAATKLNNLGKAVNEDIEMLARLKEGLIIDARYKDLAQAIKVASDMTWRKAVNHVITEDLNLAVKIIEDPSIKPDKVNMVKAKSQRKRSSKNSHLSGVRCNICNKIGHLAANCYRNRDRKSYKTQKFQNNNNHPNKRKCYLCDSTDHVIKDCPKQQEFKDYKRNHNDDNDNHKRRREDKGSRGYDGYFDNERVNMVKTSAFKPGSKKKAAIDSGATSHLISEETVAHFTRSQSEAKATNFREASIPVGTAKTGSHISAIGRIDIGRIQNAIVVEEGVIEKPLISVSKLDKAGYETMFKGGKSTIRDPEGNIVLEAPLEDDLYQFDVSQLEKFCHIMEQESAHLSNVQPADPTDLWHRRLGHISKVTIQKFIKNKKITGINLKPENFRIDKICDSCAKGKMTKVSVRKSKVGSKSFIIRRTGSEVVRDIKGPLNVVGRNGERYCIAIKDVHSKWTYLGFLKNKSEALEFILNVCKEPILHVG
jgi:hypothetical protein